MKKKLVLAYSGGLDTSVLVHMLTHSGGWEVVACHVDVGEGRDKDALVARAKKAGAVAVEVFDAQQEFARDFCYPALQANALYEGIYPLNSALSRPLIAQCLVKAARKHQATAVGHGSTGKGNDQVRFDLATKCLAPDLAVVAPQREKNMTRDAAIEYATAHGIEIPVTKRSPFSIDENLWGRSIEGGVLEQPNTEPPEEAFAWTKGWTQAPNTPGYVTIGFEAGRPVSLNQEKLDAAALLTRLNTVAGTHGVGRIDLMENRMVGIKSREVYECPAAVTLITAHKDLERFTTVGSAQRVKSFLDQRYAELVYEGQWFSPLRSALDAFNNEHNKFVTGEVKVRLFQGAAQVVGRQSPYGLYNHKMSTYGVEDAFDHKAAEGFITLLGLQLQEYSRLHGDGK